MDKNKAIKMKEVAEAKLESEDFNLSEVDGVIPSIVKLLASIATLDQVLTIDEFFLVSNVSTHLARQSESPLLVSTLLLHYLLYPVDYKISLKSLNKNLRDKSFQEKELALTILSEVATLQPNSDQIICDITHALELDTKTLSNQTIDALNALSKTVFQRFKSKNTRLDKIKKFATTFADSQLLSLVEGLKNDSQIPEEAEILLENSKKLIIKELIELKKDAEITSSNESSEDDLALMTEMLLEQIKGRLHQISKRINLDYDFFIEDFHDFLDDVAIEFESVTKDIAFSSDYTRSDIWDGLVSSEAGRIIKARYDKLKSRYDRILEQWESEYESFTKELDVSKRSMMSSFSRREFQSITPDTSKVFKILAHADVISSGVVDVAATGGIVAAIAAGAGYGGLVISVFSNPIGLGVLGVIGVAGIYKLISRPGERVNNEISRLSKEMQENIRLMLGDPIGRYEKAFNELNEKFYSAADEKFKPVIINSKLLTLYTQYKIKVLKKVSDTTTKFIESI